jgi:hypothetical protein
MLDPLRVPSGSSTSFRTSDRVVLIVKTRSTSDRVGLRSLDLIDRVGSYPQTRHDPLDPISGSAEVKADIMK